MGSSWDLVGINIEVYEYKRLKFWKNCFVWLLKLLRIIYNIILFSQEVYFSNEIFLNVCNKRWDNIWEIGVKVQRVGQGRVEMGNIGLVFVLLIFVVRQEQGQIEI